MSNGWGIKLPPGRFLPRIFGTEKYTTACVYDFSYIWSCYGMLYLMKVYRQQEIQDGGLKKGNA